MPPIWPVLPLRVRSHSIGISCQVNDSPSIKRHRGKRGLGAQEPELQLLRCLVYKWGLSSHRNCSHLTPSSLRSGPTGFPLSRWASDCPQGPPNWVRPQSLFWYHFPFFFVHDFSPLLFCEASVWFWLIKSEILLQMNNKLHLTFNLWFGLKVRTVILFS